MEDKFRIFEEEKFNKILDLVECVDTEVINQYKKVIENLPEKIIKSLSEGEDFQVFAKEYDSDLLRMEGENDSLFFTYTNFKNNLKIELSIYSFSEFDLNNENFYDDEIDNEKEEIEDSPTFVFSLTFTINNNRGLDWEVYIQPFEDNFQIISIKNHNGEMVNQKLINLSYDEIIEYADDEEYIESDEDVEMSEEDDDEYDF